MWIPDEEKITLEFDNFNIDFSCSLSLNNEGNLKPTFY